jgi:poly(3-hydroxybutyrate) depolymerase
VSKRYPLGFAFHGANRDHYNCYIEDCWGFNGELGADAVLVYMRSLRPLDSAGEDGWDFEPENQVAFFEAVLETAKSDYCIDEGRVFVAGTSSGAIFSNLLACLHGDELLAAAPVAGSLPETENCRGTPAALLIHGIDDPHVPFADGEAARDFFATRNGCSETTLPELATVHDDIRAKRDAMPTDEDIGCVDYQDCTTPVRWCEHSYGGFDLSTHGWPAPGGQLIGEFVRNLP